MEGAQLVSAEQVREWFEKHPDAYCAMCESEKATTFRELWIAWVVPPDLTDWTLLCPECLRAMLGSVPNLPRPDTTEH
jgi:hypothetical protein